MGHARGISLKLSVELGLLAPSRFIMQTKPRIGGCKQCFTATPQHPEGWGWGWGGSVQSTPGGARTRHRRAPWGVADDRDARVTRLTHELVALIYLCLATRLSAYLLLLLYVRQTRFPSQPTLSTLHPKASTNCPNNSPPCSFQSFLLVPMSYRTYVCTLTSTR